MREEVKLRRLNFVTELLQTVPSTLVVGGSGFISLIIFARLLTQADVGLYSVGVSIVMIVNAVAFGIGLAVKKRVSSDGETQVGEYLVNGVFLVVLWLGVSLSVLGGASAVVQSVVTFSPMQMGALAVFVVSHCLFTVTREYLAGLGYPGRAETSAVVRAILMIGLQVLFITVFSLGVTGLFIGGALGYGFGVLLVVWYSYRDGSVSLVVPAMSVCQRLFKFGRWSIMDQLLSTSYRWLDVVIVFLVGTASAAGQFKVAYTLVTGALMFANGVRKPAYVQLSNLYSTGGQSAIVDEAKMLTGYISWASIGAMFGVFVLGNQLLYFVFGEVYSQGGVTVSLLAVFMVFFTQRVGFEMFYYVQDRPRVSFRLNALAVGIVLSLLAVFFVTGQLQAAPIVYVAGSLLVAESIRYGVYLVLLRQETGEWFVSWNIVEQLVSGSVMAGVLYGVSQVTELNKLIVVVGLVGLGVAVYSAVEVFVFGRSVSQIKEDFDALT